MRHKWSEIAKQKNVKAKQMEADSKKIQTAKTYLRYGAIFIRTHKYAIRKNIGTEIHTRLSECEKSIGKRPPKINDENCELVASVHDAKTNTRATCGKMQHSFSYRNDANSNKSWIIRQTAVVAVAAKRSCRHRQKGTTNN